MNLLAHLHHRIVDQLVVERDAANARTDRALAELDRTRTTAVKRQADQAEEIDRLSRVLHDSEIRAAWWESRWSVAVHERDRLRREGECR